MPLGSIGVNIFNLQTIKRDAFEKCIRKKTRLPKLIPFSLVLFQPERAGNIQLVERIFKCILRILSRAGFDNLFVDAVMFDRSDPECSGHADQLLQRQSLVVLFIMA